MHSKTAAKFNRIKKYKPKRSPDHGKLNANENLIVQLDAAMKSFPAGSTDRETCQSLLMWYLRHQSLTPAQAELARNLVMRCRIAGQWRKQEPHYIYAMQAGDMVKIGYARDVDARRRDLQVGNAHDVVVVRRFQISHSLAIAKKIEARMHKKYRPFHVRGEWFKAELLAEWPEEFVMS